MPGPLDGVKILEFSEVIAGPFAGMLLGDMGADVIKVEPPWGEPWRFTHEFLPTESRQYISLNRGKRSLPLDLSRSEGREIVYRLVPDTDVVIVNARPEVPYKLGIDYETLSAKNPRLVYCENTAFGRKGPQSHRAGYDIIAQAMTGLVASAPILSDGIPQGGQGVPIADFATGIAMAWGVCTALYHRERTGKGQKIESTLLATAMGIQTMRMVQVAAVDDEPRGRFFETLARLKERGAHYGEVHDEYRRQLGGWRARSAYYRAYEAKDGVLVVGCLSDPLRKRFLNVLGLEDIRFRPDYDPSSEEAEAFSKQLNRGAEELFRQRTVDEWLDILDEAGVPAGPVRFAEELMADEQAIANGLVVDLEHSLAGRVKMVGPLISMTESPLEAKRASPALGEHSSEVLEQLGYSQREIQRLKESGVTR